MEDFKELMPIHFITYIYITQPSQNDFLFSLSTWFCFTFTISPFDLPLHYIIVLPSRSYEQASAHLHRRGELTVAKPSVSSVRMYSGLLWDLPSERFGDGAGWGLGVCHWEDLLGVESGI